MNDDELALTRIEPDLTVKEALKRLDESSHRVLFVTDSDSLLMGALSDGDIRRSLLAGVGLDEKIHGSYNKNPLTVSHTEPFMAKCRDLFLKSKVLLIPLVDSEGRLKGAVSWDQAFENSDTVNAKQKGQIDIPVVVMAGGKGTRLAPFTNVLPKPLIPVGDKTILELIVDSFRENGVSRYYFTVNYRGEMIKAYFDTIARDYMVNYVWEKEFLGTAGCLRYLREAMKETFIVSNCDIIVKADYSDVLRFHKQSKSLLTVVSSIQHVKVPYGVIEFQEGGRVTSMQEKPEFSLSINTGVYFLEPECIDFIPENTFFHMTHLMEAIMASGGIVSTYPVNEKDYLDIGQWEEYRKSVSQLN